MVISLCDLTAYGRENGYTESSIFKVSNEIIPALLKSGNFKTPQGIIIGAIGVDPFIKVNPKSLRIRLFTSDVRDTIIINHPSNTWAYQNGGSPDNLIIGSHKFFKTPIKDKNTEEFSELGKFTVIY